jgi:DNA topoisomerase IB
VAKAGVEQDVRIDDPEVFRVLSAITKGRRASAPLLASRDDGHWVTFGADDVNAMIRDLFGMDVTAKDFRTWHATVTVAAALASVERASSRTARNRQIRAAVVEASELLGNTPAVARASYVDPRVIDLFESGTTIRPKRGQDALDREVVRLLSA